MTSSFSFELFNSTVALPLEWDTIAVHDLFLTRKYLQILEQSAPANMKCHFIGVYNQNQLCGVALAQFLDLNQVPSFGARDKSLKTAVRNFAFKNFGAHVLILGNNMLTGQHAMAFAKNTHKTAVYSVIEQACKELKKRYKAIGKKVHITTYKDFEEEEINSFEIPDFKQYPYTTAEFDQLIGVYTNSQMPVSIIIATNGVSLSAQPSGQPSFQLDSKQKNIFTFDMAGIVITFNPETKSFVREQGVSSFTFTKKEE